MDRAKVGVPIGIRGFVEGADRHARERPVHSCSAAFVMAGHAQLLESRGQGTKQGSPRKPMAVECAHAAEATPYTQAMLYWVCRGARHYAGQRGQTSRAFGPESTSATVGRRRTRYLLPVQHAL